MYSKDERRKAKIRELEAEKQRLLVESQSIARRRQGLVKSGIRIDAPEVQKVIRDAYVNQRALLGVEVALESARRMRL